MLSILRVRRLSSMVRLVPTLGRLALRLMRDKRVPRRHRAVMAATAAYALSPLDLLPEPLPVVGRVDDLIVLAAGLGWLLKFSPGEVIDEHLGELGMTRSQLEDRVGDVVIALLGPRP